MPTRTPTDVTFGHLHAFYSDANETARDSNRGIEFMSSNGQETVEPMSKVCRADVEQM